MSVAKKALFGLCIVGAGGAGYYFGTVTQGQPVKATVTVEGNKTKKTVAKKDNGSKTTSEDSNTADKKNEPKAKDNVKKKDHARVHTYRHQRQAGMQNKPITKKPAKATGVRRSTFTGQTVKPKVQPKTKKRMFLTGRKTKYSYTPSEIAQANQIYRHHKGLSFAQCLAQAQKGK